MKNIMEIDGYRAVIAYDPDIEMFRGEFIGLNGGADFYATDIEQLKKEGKQSLNLFLKACEERGISPQKEYSGKFNLRLPVNLHADIAQVAGAEGKSLNQWVIEKLEHVVHPEI